MLGIIDKLFKSYFTLVYRKGEMGAEGAVFLMVALFGLNIFAILIFLWMFLDGSQVQAIYPTLLLMVIFFILNLSLTRRYIKKEKYKFVERGSILNSIIVLILHWVITLMPFLKLILY